jgi:hypothetical protein
VLSPSDPESYFNAAQRNLAIEILKPSDHPSIAAACRYHARDAIRVLAALGISPP